MDQTAWRTFLKARITQEQGKDQEALKVFDELLLAYPDNPHLLASRAAALQRLGREDEAIAGRIAAKYASAAKTLVGPADTPEAWVSRLKNMQADLDRFESSGAIASAVAW
jgi:predicted Zn-dependent protease